MEPAPRASTDRLRARGRLQVESCLVLVVLSALVGCADPAEAPPAPVDVAPPSIGDVATRVRDAVRPSLAPTPSGEAVDVGHRALTFETARRHLRDEVYADHHVEAYCGCPYDDDGEVDGAACGYAPRGHSARTRRIEWEHQVPAARFGNVLACWQGCAHGGGRRCCERSPAHGGDALFRAMLGDLHNLVPAVGELNEDRSDRPYGEVAGEARRYGACDFEVDARDRHGPTEPPASMRGDVARAWLYMAATYPTRLSLSPDERALFARWSAADPPDAWERERDARIARIQGNHNPFVAGAP